MTNQMICASVIAQSVFEATPGNVPFVGTAGIRVASPPTPQNDTGLLIMVHGLGSDWDEHDNLALEWARQFNVFCLQIRDRHAGPRGLKPPMDLGKYQTVDVLRTAKWATANLELDLHRLYLWGCSGGGHVVLQSLVMAPHLFTHAISCCPFTRVTFPGEIRGEWKDGWVSMLVAENENPCVLEQSEIDVRSPLLHSDRLSTPLLLMHGDKDVVISVSHSRNLAKRIGNRRSFRYVEIIGGDHDFFGGPINSKTRRLATEHYAGSILQGRGRRGGDWTSKPFSGFQLRLDASGLPRLDARSDATPGGLNL